MNQPYLFRKNLPPLLQLLYRPMLFISLGLHGILLMLPIPQPTKSQIEQKPEQEELEITQLLAPPKKPSPQASVPTKPSPRQLPQPSPKITPQQVTPPTPQSTPSSTTTPSASPTPLPSPEESTTQEPTPELTTEASPNASDDNETFQNLFGEISGEVAEELGVDPSYFAQPELFFTAESLKTDEPQQKQEITRIKWISLKTPEQVFTEIEPQLTNSGIEVSLHGEYGGGNIYKLQKGNFVKYLNLVPTATSIGTMIVVWNSDPNANQ